MDRAPVVAALLNQEHARELRRPYLGTDMLDTPGIKPILASRVCLSARLARSAPCTSCSSTGAEARGYTARRSCIDFGTTRSLRCHPEAPWTTPDDSRA
jgi:hypothetical protein